MRRGDVAADARLNPGGRDAQRRRR